MTREEIEAALKYAELQLALSTNDTKTSCFRTIVLVLRAELSRQENAPTIESPRWTPCSVALPEGQSDVLIYFDRCGGEIGIGYYAERADGVKFWCAMGSMLCYNVLAWQPLPEPYRGEA